ncbi:protein ANKUB1-like [Xyrauchen texanus]|uniref:protein ANKUB1-like n=1 Tax=Xyrauchen texanus TaxID=154827 RepID=UPI002242B3C4|nr:protein ANKUB1-like [Xyrauchen texanus]
MIKERFYVQLSGDEQVQHFLELRFTGAALQDNWCVTDIGITTGSTIHCQVKEVNKAILHVFSAITKETLPIMGDLLSSSVSKLKSLVSLQFGIPVTAFTLSTESGLLLYDCNLLSDYAVQAGHTLRLDTWDGWNEFLKVCLRGHRCTVQRHLSDEKPVLRFQKRVALYVAAAHGHLDLASWLIKSGVKAEDPVGVHPYRTWCSVMNHPDTLKCPAHAAAEAGQLLILKLFISTSIANLACCDPSGRNLLQIAIGHRHRECVSHLVSKLYTTVNFPGYSLPMQIYLQIKTWIQKAKMRQQRLFGSKVGDPVQVDGFPMQRMFLNPIGRMLRECVDVKNPSCGVSMTTSFVGPSCLSHYPAIPSSQIASVKLPQLHHSQTQKSTGRDQNLTRNRACGRKNPTEILAAENSYRSTDTWWKKVPLPHSILDTRLQHLLIKCSTNSAEILTIPRENFRLLCGRTLQENAIYCLAIASAFTDKTWLQQLAIAQTLARRSIRNFLSDQLEMAPRP